MSLSSGSLRSFLSLVLFFPSFLRRVRQAEPMQKTPPRQRPAAALDNPQLDLPLNLPSEPRLSSVAPSPAMPGTSAAPAAPAPAMPATLRGDVAPTDTTETASPSAPPLRAPLAPDGSRNRQLALGSQMLDYRLKRSSRRTIGFTIDGTGLAITAPRWVTIGAIESAIAEKEKLIFK